MTDPDERPEHEHDGMVMRMIDHDECQGQGCMMCGHRGFLRIWATPAEWLEHDSEH